MSPEDFAADVTRRIDEKKASVHRDQVRGALSQAESLKKEGKVAAGWGPFMAAVSAGLSEASQEARSEFEDHLDKSSLASSWDGEKYVPKALDVHSTEAIVSSWRGGVRLAYTKLSDESQLHAIGLTEKNQLEVITVTPEEGLDLRYAQANLDIEIDSVRQGLRATTGSVRRELKAEIAAVRRELSLAKMRAHAETAVLSTEIDAQIADLSYNFGRVLREHAKELEDLTGAMMVRAYDFRLDGEDRGHQRSDFRTGVSSNDYPVALINNWFLDLDCDIRYAPWNPELLVNWKSGTPPREWLVSARDADRDSDCRYFKVVVTFIKGSIIGSGNRLGRNGRTKGGTLQLR